jgi:MacB-like protein
VAVWGWHTTVGRESASLSDFLDWRAGAPSFERLLAIAPINYPANGQGEAELVRGAMTTADFFPTLGVTPAVGRDFLPGEDARGAPRVVILGYDYWPRRFGGGPMPSALRSASARRDRTPSSASRRRVCGGKARSISGPRSATDSSFAGTALLLALVWGSTA